MKSFFETYFVFHYGIGFVIGAVVFGGCMFIISKDKMKRVGMVSGKDVFWSLALSVYLVFLLGTTLLNREWADGREARLDLFWSYRYIIEAGSKQAAGKMAKQIVLNILAFVPWGFLTPKSFGETFGFYKVVGSAFLLSLGIELMQLIGQCGLFEFDDMVHNTIGAAVGYGIQGSERRSKIILDDFRNSTD